MDQRGIASSPESRRDASVTPIAPARLASWARMAAVRAAQVDVLPAQPRYAATA